MRSMRSHHARHALTAAVCFLFFGLMICTPLTAKASVWEKTSGPPGISVHVIYEANNILFAGTDKQGVYRSMDNGQSWEPANGGIERTRIADIVASGPNLLAAAGASLCGNSVNVFKSTDNGTTWTPTIGLAGKSAESFAVKDGFVYAGVFTIQDDGIWRSAD